MKKTETRRSLFADRQPRFISKIHMKQVGCRLAACVFLLGNIGLLPIHVVATDTTESTSDTTAPSTSTTLEQATSQPAPSQETCTTTQEITSHAPVSLDETSASAKQGALKEKQKRVSPQEPRLFSSDWYAEEESGRMVIKSYTGDPATIKVPSVIEDKPVAIDLNAVLGTYLRSQTKAFEIEASKEGQAPVKVTGKFEQLFMDNLSLSSALFADADTSAIENMRSVFSGCKNLSQVDVSKWDTGNVTNMASMFLSCHGLSTLDVSNWDTKNVSVMYSMFANCRSLKSLDASRWRIEKLLSIEALFNGCTNLIRLDLSSWNTVNVQALYGVFDGCEALAELKITRDFLTFSLLRELPVSENNGKTTYAWVMDDGETVYDSTSEMVAGHHTLRDDAVHTYTIQRQHEVAFDTDGGTDTPAMQKVFENKKITDPAYSGTKKQNTFIGWTLNGQPVDFTTCEITRPSTLRAQWGTIQYAVRFNKNNGAGAMANQEFFYGEEKILTPNAFVRTGYTFKNWNTQVDGQGTTTYSDGQLVKNLSEIEGDQVDLYAQWQPITYKVTFDSAGGTSIPEQSYTIEQGIETFATPKRPGYTFQGWYAENKKIEKIAKGETGDQRVKARWKATSYRVIFEPNGGTDDASSQQFIYDKTSNLFPASFTRKGYFFTGWNTQPDGKGTAYSDAQAVNNLTADQEGSVTLYAQWQPDKTALEELINKEKERRRRKTSYTKDSWQTYERAMAKAEKVQTDRQATVDEIQIALTSVKNAIVQLVPSKTSDTSQKPAPKKAPPQKSAPAKSYPRSGTLVETGLKILGLASVAIAVAGLIKRKDD
ncbi:hypothetical protein IGI66_003477 [Enterococcus sp. AZ048]|uniref:InlB B-repeat-containing protein n=1 Tax=Enterococcus sp. AZ048 TaxID=2774658 RepID=UPI003F2073F7